MTVTLIDNCVYQEFCMKSYQIFNYFLNPNKSTLLLRKLFTNNTQSSVKNMGIIKTKKKKNMCFIVEKVFETKS